MDYSGEITTTQRIAILEKAVAMARREVSVALLKSLATSTIGERDERALIRARIQALKTIIDNAEDLVRAHLVAEAVAIRRQPSVQTKVIAPLLSDTPKYLDGFRSHSMGEAIFNRQPP
jgi:hypothetical protein